MSELQLKLAAETLGPLLDEVVFLGGATVHLWLTEPGAPPVRATDDVDVICEVVTRTQYYRLGDRLRQRGLHQAADESVICRWRHADTGLAIDVMPVAEDVLGFANPWYPQAIETAESRALPSGAVIRAAKPALLVATKLVAWRGRGQADLLGSLDVHDVLVLIDGRPELTEELQTAGDGVRSFVATELGALRDQQYFDYAVQSVTSSYGAVAAERAAVLGERIDELLRRVSP